MTNSPKHPHRSSKTYKAWRLWRHQIRAPFLIVIMLAVAWATFQEFSNPFAHKLTDYTIEYSSYTPDSSVFTPITTDANDIQNASSTLAKPARAVPILIYHGIVKKQDEVNTSRENFIAQMEALKKNGYETITLSDYEQFRLGNFTLPAKPIIITFDDGRKDSYYPTDSVFAALGFKATIFEASGPTLAGNLFYLSFDELRHMKETGRWDIQAHGRHSHDHTIISPDPASSTGRYLSSLIYRSNLGRLETEDEFYARVKQDYEDSIKDIESITGIYPYYIAIPLNDYGNKQLTMISNYPKASQVNGGIIKNLFRLALIQVNGTEEPLRILENPYNFSYTNPYHIKRIEIGAMSVNNLMSILNKYEPRDEFMTVDELTSLDKRDYDGIFEASSTDPSVIFSATSTNESAYAVAGQDYFESYIVRTNVNHTNARSMAVVVNAQDRNHYIACGVSDNSFYLRSYTDGEYTDIVPAIYNEQLSALPNLYWRVVSRGGAVSCYVNDEPIFQTIDVPYVRGKAGFKVFDDAKTGYIKIDRLLLTKYSSSTH